MNVEKLVVCQQTLNLKVSEGISNGEFGKTEMVLQESLFGVSGGFPGGEESVSLKRPPYNESTGLTNVTHNTGCRRR